MTEKTQPTDAELLPCPFCGEAATHSFNSLYGDMSMASCKSCGATAYAPKWNRRAVLAKWGQPAQAAEPVAWLDPWTGTKVTTDYDAYGKHGIPLVRQQPVAREPLTPERVKEIVRGAGYDQCGIPDTERAAFINGLRHGEREHGIKGSQHAE